MNPLSFATDRIHDLWNVVAKPLKALFVVGICYFINRVTSPGDPWWHWVAFGMSIVVLVAWARAFKTIVLLLVVYYVGRWIYRNYGDAARARFDEWVNGTGSASNGSRTPRPSEAKDVLRLVDNHDAVREAGIVR